jgi:hypothetical protein
MNSCRDCDRWVWERKMKADDISGVVVNIYEVNGDAGCLCYCVWYWFLQLYPLCSRLSGVVFSVLASSPKGRGFKPGRGDGFFSTPYTRHGGAWRERRYSSYSFSISALDGEWSASRPGRAFTPGERTPGTHWTGGWVGPRAGLDTEPRGKILCPRRDSNHDRLVVQPVVRHWLS